MNRMDQIALGWLIVMSGVTFLMFGVDKWRARRSADRVSEWALCVAGAFGGWPAGLLAMMVFRHKTVKWTFQFKYALALIPFAALVWCWFRYR